MWLYAYEASLKGWTGVATKKFIPADKAFGPLWEKKVSFFNLNAHVLEVGASSKKDINLSLKVKSSAGDEFDFDFDQGDGEEDWMSDQEDYVEDWGGY